MKKTFVIIATLFLSLTAYSQSEFEPETYLGIKLGGNISGIITDPIINQKTNMGFTSGIVFKHISQKNLGVQIELNFNQAGWNENLESTNTYLRQLNYIQLPFMTHIRLGSKNTSLIVNIGPYFSYLLSEKEEIDLLDGVEEKSYYRKEADNRVGLGLSFGIGFSKNTSIGLFQLEGRISSSLADVFKSSTDFPFSSSKNLNAEVSLYYLIDYKKIGIFNSNAL